MLHQRTCELKRGSFPERRKALPRAAARKGAGNNNRGPLPQKQSYWSPLSECLHRALGLISNLFPPSLSENPANSVEDPIVFPTNGVSVSHPAKVGHLTGEPPSAIPKQRSSAKTEKNGPSIAGRGMYGMQEQAFPLNTMRGSPVTVPGWACCPAQASPPLYTTASLSQGAPLSRQPQQMPHELPPLPPAATQPPPPASPTYLPFCG
ncbi:hypothetical protein SKAU_G00007520 [Synaphobranchus kaupii]|uniref:Uncharacterized protein n=1 Tax=Synaphobranchus kaupii TaxID=118154 RepID=A0A9Q1GAK5_SYNKA|nr:hypothetical protein SKAU_G00007520 [Synaphobranchus kaupii]